MIGEDKAHCFCISRVHTGMQNIWFIQLNEFFNIFRHFLCASKHVWNAGIHPRNAKTLGYMKLTASNLIFLSCARQLHTFNENVTIINFYLRPGPNVPYIVCSELKSLVRPPTRPTGCCCYAADWVTIGDITSLLRTLRMLSQPNSIRLKINFWCNLNFYLDLVKCGLKGWFSVYNIVLT